MLLCICEKFKASILFHNPPFGYESGWAFYRSQFFGGNRCNEPLSYFFEKGSHVWSSVAVFFVCRKELMIYQTNFKTTEIC